MSGHLLVTGYARSGMTLVNRLLDAHPEVSLADRIALDGLVRAMHGYREARGLSRSSAPFTPLFDEVGISVGDVSAFFRDDRPDLSVWLAQTADAHAAAVGKQARPVRGTREHFCEVLAPYLLERGFRVLFMLRDPLDLVASARLGDPGGALNARINVLEMVRQWRKSVALAILTALHPGARVLRYEDLVLRPESWEGVCRWLEIAVVSPPALLGAGDAWAGNSSFGPLEGLSHQPIGRGARLPSAVSEFVRAATAPERRWLGYESGRPSLVPYTSACELDPDRMGDTAAESEREATRRILLESDDLPAADGVRWFLAPEVHRQLRSAWARDDSPTGRM